MDLSRVCSETQVNNNNYLQRKSDRLLGGLNYALGGGIGFRKSTFSPVFIDGPIGNIMLNAFQRADAKAFMGGIWGDSVAMTIAQSQKYDLIGHENIHLIQEGLSSSRVGNAISYLILRRFIDYRSLPAENSAHFGGCWGIYGGWNSTVYARTSGYGC